MVSRTLLHVRGFGAGVLLNSVAAFAMMGSSYFITQYLQSVLGYTPLHAALWSLVPALAVGVAAPTSAWAGRCLGRNRVVSCGFLLMACGLALIALTGAGARDQLLAGAAVMGCGTVAVVAQVCDLALAAIPQRRAGSAASLLETGQELGGALGMALLGSVGTAVYRHDLAGALPAWLPPVAAKAVRGTLGGADAVASRLPRGFSGTLRTAAQDAFVDGMQAASWCGVILLAVAAACAVRALSDRRPERAGGARSRPGAPRPRLSDQPAGTRAVPPPALATGEGERERAAGIGDPRS
jgi:DHA2 family multidrug resistance protein-like MFS transporter